MDSQNDVSFAYACAEFIFAFVSRVLVAGFTLTLLAVALKYAGKKPKKVIERDEDSGNMNEYLDGFLRDAGIKIHKLNADPLNLPDTKHGFQKKMFFLSAKGGLTTRRAKLKGLSSVHRAGDATLKLNSLTNLTIRATLGVHNVNVTSECKAWFGDRIRNFLFGANIQFLKGTAEIEIPILSGDQPKATSLVIDDIGKITLDVKHLGPLNWVIKNLGYLLLNSFKDALKDSIAPPLQTAMNKGIAKIQIPSFL